MVEKGSQASRADGLCSRDCRYSASAVEIGGVGRQTRTNCLVYITDKIRSVYFGGYDGNAGRWSLLLSLFQGAAFA